MNPSSPAYWTNLDLPTLTAITGLIIAVGGVSAPFVKGWLENKAGASVARSKREETAQERIERIADEQFKRVEIERDRAIAETEAARADGRGIAAWCSFLWHAGNNAYMRYAIVVGMLEQAGDGRMSQERAAAMATEIRARMPGNLPAPPLLPDAAENPPPKEIP